MIFKLSNRRSPQEVKLKSLEWAVITQLNGEKTVAQIGEILALNQEELQDIFGRLIQEGLLELVNHSSTTQVVPQHLLKEIEYILTLYVGPIAAILVDDVLSEMKLERKSVEVRYLPFLVERLSYEITSPEKQLKFQREALEIIRDLDYA
ncbi:MAG: hypothetical protein D6715_13840 [Calditrichaeota bacterium]|nr:MAG: hypothetical protein D6715_13840 [Calditrichota bacterium]